MCGIAGLFNWGDRRTLLRMADLQAHRGPDDAGFRDFRTPDGSYIGLASRRLAILDTSPEGHMPMSNGDGSIWIVYNGETYNFKELRRQLESRGCRFRSGSDTEVILRLYEQEGPECVRRMNGMFAFAICDLRGARPKLVIARDHFGIKPLYFVRRGAAFAFASEVKAFTCIEGFSAGIDPEALHQYLTFLWVPEPKTLFQGVEKIPAGHYAVITGDDMSLVQYWDLQMPERGQSFPMAERDLVNELRERFFRSVQAQMVSDVPIGAFLSAGLDSSSIVAAMAHATSQPIQTYTISFPRRHTVGERTIDDPAVAQRTAKHFGCKHTDICVEPDVAALLPKLVWHMDEPVADPAIITAYLVCREARKSVTVLLSGVGGDELFAGYRKHVAYRWAQMYRFVPGAIRSRMLEPFLLGLPSFRGTRVKGFARLAKKMARSASLPDQDAFLTNCTYLDADQKTSLYTPEFRQQIEGMEPWSAHRSCFDRVHDADFVNQMLYVDIKQFMVSLNMNYNDKMSMAASVETRVPFMDHELVDFVVQNVPPSLKLQGHIRPVTKYIFRRAMEPVLPAEVLRQKKAGFSAPVDYWLAHDLRGMVGDLFSPSRIRQRGLFNPAHVETLVQQHREGRQDWSMQIWALLTLELWMQSFVDHSNANALSGSAGCIQ